MYANGNAVRSIVIVKCSDNMGTQLNVSGICKLKVLSKKLVYVDRI